MPTERYNKGRQDWVIEKPIDVVYEANIGWDKRQLYFPGVSTCIALAMVTSDGMLLGAHFDKILSSADVDNMLNRLLGKKTPQSSVINLVVVGNLTYRDDAGAGFMAQADFQGDQLVLTFAKKLGVKGVASSHDQGQEANKHYCAQSIGEGKMRLYYADTTLVKGTQVAFDRDKAVWQDEPPLKPLRAAY